MIKSIPVNVKKRGRGRPATGTDPVVAVRLPPHVLAQVDRWAADKGYTRSEAIRDMVAYAISGRVIDDGRASRRAKKRKAD